MSALPLTIPSTFPLVGLGVVSTVLLNIFQQANVSKARKECNVPYPTLYVSEADAASDPKKMRYNCVQRAHANTLENVSYVLAMLGFYGLFHPKYATTFTLLWVVGRINYTLGYSTGTPAKRNGGLSLVSYVGLLGLLFGSGTVAVTRGLNTLF